MTGDPRAIVRAGYDALVDRYGAWADGTADPGRERMLAELMARLPDGARVLDLGCGSGIASTRALAERFAVTGIDLSAGQLAEARRNVPEATFLHGDIATIELPTGTWDAVTAFYAIGHIPRAEHAAVFERVARWLVPGGLFLASLGARDSPDWTGEWLGEPMFFSGHDAATNRELLADAGFELLVDEVIATPEPDGPVPFQWVLAQAGARA